MSNSIWAYSMLFVSFVSKYPFAPIRPLVVRMHFNPKERWASTDSGRKRLLDALMNHSLQPTMGIGNHDPNTLPRRYMPPGTYSDLFRLYHAECLALDAPAASSTTFFRTLKSSGWRAKLKFRHASNHAQCRVCHQLKSNVKCAKDISAHAQAADRYMRHLGGVFADRQVYAQTKIRAKVQRDILCCIIDSMDKSKFRLPRFAQGRTPKPLENKKRPELEFTTCIMHGHSVNIFLGDAEQSAGSDWSLEILSRSLNKTYAKFQRANECWPNHLKVYTDNTPKEPWTFSHVEFFHQKNL